MRFFPVFRTRCRLATASLVLAACSSGLDPAGIEDTFVPGDGTTDPTGVTDPTGEPIDPTEPQDNEPPTADAGSDVSAIVTDVVELDGSGSYDPDGDALDFSWTLLALPAGSTTHLLNETRPNPSFFVDVPGQYVVEVVVDDGESTDADEVVVTATSDNGGPVANAGPDQTVDVGDTVQLNGSASFDPDSDPLDFEWALVSTPAGSTAALDDPFDVLPRFTADVSGLYVVELRVSDDGGGAWSAEDDVRITAAAASDSDCFSCAAAQLELERRMRAGDVASSFGLVLLPLLALFWNRRD